MHRVFVALAAAGLLTLSTAGAQAAQLDLRKYTCGQFAALKGPARANIVLLTVGYMMGRRGRTEFNDRVVLDSNGANQFAGRMAKVCASQPKETWLKAIEKAFSPKRSK